MKVSFLSFDIKYMLNMLSCKCTVHVLYRYTGVIVHVLLCS